ncbi:MAG: undecaprenyl/decaprenyl-phosphate alpha-N-acetylglucosaminyl 1-phosphate transferase [Lysobacteraceae bacterium]|nr:MAG: undecaprenyl/decaprenyl-phosphate alpha-N-acetylglucosaminyl 1-phosphate transferase [Xanthomonadaceae bacterium]
MEEAAIQGALLALASTWLLVWMLKPVSFCLKLLDYPGGTRKAHETPTPVTGGLAMTLAAAAGGVFVWEGSEAMIGLLLGMLLLLVVGLLDDLRDIRWPWRVAAQVVAALSLYYVGGVRVEQIGNALGFPGHTLGPLSLPLTVFATVGLINAINLIDGVDGLAGSLVFVALLMLCAAALYAGNSALAGNVLILAAAVAGFLAWNFRFPGRSRAAAFMGNSGSALLGLAMAWVCFRLTQNPGHPVNPVLALWLLPVPVADTLVLIVRRIRQGRSPFHAGCDHIHHCLREAGFGPFGICAVLVAFSLVTGLAAGQAMRLDVPNVLILAAFLGLCVGWYWLSAKRERALGVFRGLRMLLVGNVAVARVVVVPAASNDDLGAEGAKVKASKL